MEVLSLLLFIVILILIISLKNSISTRFDKLESELFIIRDLLFKAGSQKITTPPPSPEASTKFKESTQRAPEEKPVKAEPLVPQTLHEDKSLSDSLDKLIKEADNVEETIVPTGLSEKVVLPGPIPAAQPIREHKPSFMERNPDLEKFIGENLVSKIGIVILVLAIGYFVKFAIDNDWIGPVGRVAIGVLCGAILVGVAHALRNSYKAFSSVLAGGGLAVFYFTITLGFHQFHLFSQTVAFLIMVVITAFAVILSILYNRQEVAVLALIGGFATPFMVSTGSGNFRILFSYLVILNAGLLVIAYNKAWRLLNLLAFIFTVILFGSWLFTLKPNETVSTYSAGLIFATVFYLLFFSINVAHNIRENKKFIASDFGILLANTALYFTAGLYLLTVMKAGEYRGLFTAAISIFNLAASYILFRNRKIDSNILYLLIGITLSFISLTAPIQLNGNNITLFWASEAVLLYWLYQKSAIRIIRFGSLVVWIAMLVSLMMDWLNVYGLNSARLPIIINKGFITTLFAAVASYLLFILRKEEAGNMMENKGIRLHKNVFRLTGILLLFAAGAFEINYQFISYYPVTDLYVLYLLLYTFAYVFLFILITEKIPSLPLNFYIKMIVLSFCVLLYLFTIAEVFEIQKAILVEQRYKVHFTAHWLATLLLAMILYKLIHIIRLNQQAVQKTKTILTWITCTVVVIFLSAEVHLIINNIFYVNENFLTEIQRVYVKTGLPILWGLCSFGFMWLGMRHKYRPLRIISLTLFSITLIKLFFFDISNIPVAGKIAAFFSLGILLLVISFMYQRLKKIIIEDEKKPFV